MSGRRLVPPGRPLSDGEIVLRMRREQDMAAIAQASHDPETQRRPDDEPLTDALRLAAIWGLRELGFARVAAEAAADNYASIRAMEKAGFHREGTLRAHCKTHGERHDCVMFSLVRTDLQRH